MLQKKFTFQTFDELVKIIDDIRNCPDYLNASGVLMQLYNPRVDSDDEKIVNYINESCDKACLIGLTCANIADIEYDISQNPIELNVTFFKKTTLIEYDFDMTDATGFVAGRIINEALEVITDTKCMMVCYSCGSAVIHSFGKEFSHHNLPLFGAKAGRSIRALNTARVYGKRANANGIVAILFSSDDLHLYMDNCLGFKEIGLKMLVTKTDGDNIISEVDYKPATEVYSKYLNVRPGKYFVHNVCEFPMIFHRNDCVVARVPSAYGEDNSIHFTSDVIKGDTFRLSYGNADNLLGIVDKSVQNLKKFNPEAILLFECGNRIRFLKDKAASETDSYKVISPELSVAVGYAELFFSSSENGAALNSALVAVGLTENLSSKNEIRSCVNSIDDEEEIEDERDYIPFVDRILHFLEKTSSELDSINKELGKKASTDQLTRIYNRWELEHKINDVLDLCSTGNTPASIIFMDIDHFKHINDTFGHDVGDMVLRASVDLIRDHLEPQHVFGRWGGEEFIYVLPGMELEKALEFAESLRKQIDENCFVTVKHLTMSFGVTQNKSGDTLDSFVKRADQALYTAKETGRNKVVSLL